MNGIVDTVESGSTRDLGSTTTSRWLFHRPSDPVLLVAALAVYCALIFYQIDRYPLYFFADEAIPGVDAYAIAHTGADHTGKRFPLFFEGLGEYPLSLTVYLQVPLIALFGKTVSAVRTTTALLSLFGVMAVYLTLRQIFHSKVAWLAPLLLVVSPFWYLHSRTGFEYVPATSFFLLYFYFTVRSLDGSRVNVVLAAVSAAASFYSYTPGRGWILVATVLTTLFLAPTHRMLWRRWLLLGALLALLLAPYVVLQITQPAIALRRLEAAGFADFRNLSLIGKVEHFGHEYLRALDPRFWFTWSGTPHDGPMQRHVIPKLPLVPVWLAPFSLLGLALCLFRIRRPESRTLLAFLLAVPVPASLLEIDNHRCLPIGAFLVLFAGIALGEVFARVRGSDFGYRAAVGALTAFLVGYAFWFGSYARNTSIRRYSDYGFYGLQMGAPQLFTWIEQNSDRFTAFRVGTNLFNMGEAFTWFFLPQPTLNKVKMVELDNVCRGRITWPQGTAFLFPAGFPAGILSAGCPLDVRVLYTLTDPLGRPVMMAGSLTKEGGFSAWAAAQLAKSRLPVVETTTAYGHEVTVEHPRFDIGSLTDLFDGNPGTIARTQQINPALYVIRFKKEQRLGQVEVVFANTTAADVTVTTTGPTGEVAWGQRHYSRDHGDTQTVLLRMAPPISVSAITVEVRLTDQDRFGSVHLSGIMWK